MRIEDQIAIASHQHLALARDGQGGCRPFGRGIVQLGDLACDFDEFDGAERALARLRLDLRNPRERGEHREHRVEIGDGIADQRLIAGAERRP